MKRIMTTARLGIVAAAAAAGALTLSPATVSAQPAPANYICASGTTILGGTAIALSGCNNGAISLRPAAVTVRELTDLAGNTVFYRGVCGSVVATVPGVPLAAVNCLNL